MINPRVGEALVAGQREENVAAISNVERDAIGHNQLLAHRNIGASAEFGLIHVDQIVGLNVWTQKKLRSRFKTWLKASVDHTIEKGGQTFVHGYKGRYPRAR